MRHTTTWKAMLLAGAVVVGLTSPVGAENAAPTDDQASEVVGDSASPSETPPADPGAPPDAPEAVEEEHTDGLGEGEPDSTSAVDEVAEAPASEHPDDSQTEEPSASESASAREPGEEEADGARAPAAPDQVEPEPEPALVAPMSHQPGSEGSTDVQIFLSPGPYTYGETITLAVNVTDTRTGCVIFDVCSPPSGDVTLTRTLGPGDSSLLATGTLAPLPGSDRTGTVVFTFHDLGAGNNAILASYQGNFLFAHNGRWAQFEIGKAACTLTVEPTSVAGTYGEPVFFVGSIDSSSTHGTARAGELTVLGFWDDEVERVITPFGPAGFVRLDGLVNPDPPAINQQTFYAVYDDDNHEPCTSEPFSAFIFPAECSLTVVPDLVEIEPGEDAVLLVDPNSESSDGHTGIGELRVYIEGQSSPILEILDFPSPFGFVRLADLEEGTHLVSMTFRDDNHSECTSNTVTIQVAQPPVANDDHYSTLMGESVLVEPLENDHDPAGGDLTAVLVTPPSNGNLTVFFTELAPGGEFLTAVYRPDDEFVGTDSFTYQARNSEGVLSSEATVTIEVIDPVVAEYERLCKAVNDWLAEQRFPDRIDCADVPDGDGCQSLNDQLGTLGARIECDSAAVGFMSTVTLTASPNPGTEGERVELVAVVTSGAPTGPEPTGAVEFSLDGQVQGQSFLSSPATFTLEPLVAGTYEVTARYLGDDNFLPEGSHPVVLVIGESAIDEPAPVQTVPDGSVETLSGGGSPPSGIPPVGVAPALGPPTPGTPSAAAMPRTGPATIGGWLILALVLLGTGNVMRSLSSRRHRSR